MKQNMSYNYKLEVFLEIAVENQNHKLLNSPFLEFVLVWSVSEEKGVPIMIC